MNKVVAALAGVRIIDLTSEIAGPYCTKLLADSGAEVIKVEPPTHGDIARHLGPFPHGEPSPETSALFLHLNTNKRAVSLDVTQEAGAELLRKLIRHADAVVDDGVLAMAHGTDWTYDALSADQPGLVVTAVSAFGRTGPYRDYRAPDIVLSAMSGWMNAMGDPDKPPLQSGGPYIQYVTGLWAAAGTLSALLGALISGKGELVNISKQESAIATAVYDTVRHSYSGEVRTRYGNRFGLGDRGELFISLQPCSNGDFLLMPGPYRERLPALLGLPDLLDDERFRGDDLSVSGSNSLEAEIRVALCGRTKEELFHTGQGMRLAAAYVASPDEILESEQLRERGYFATAEHATAGTLRYTGSPFRFSEARNPSLVPAPTLGQHNEEIYRTVAHIGVEEFASLQERGVI